MNINPAFKILLGVIIGAILGGVIGYYGKCHSGVCPLTSNPYTGAIVGAIIGLLFTLNR
jgi:gas vesicle protein